MSRGYARAFGLKPEDFPRVVLKTDELKLEILEHEHDRLIMIDGAITTWERLDNLDVSVCHLFADGRILRHGRQIGTREDIEIVQAN